MKISSLIASLIVSFGLSVRCFSEECHSDDLYCKALAKLHDSPAKIAILKERGQYIDPQWVAAPLTENETCELQEIRSKLREGATLNSYERARHLLLSNKPNPIGNRPYDCSEYLTAHPIKSAKSEDAEDEPCFVSISGNESKDEVEAQITKAIESAQVGGCQR